MNKEKNFASAIVYVHNAENRIQEFLRTVITVMEENFEHSEIICVNDFSEDDSLSIIKKISNEAQTTSVSVINMSYFHGLELAMNAGVDMSIGDFVFEFDNTYLNFDPSMIMKIYRHALEGYDIVSASPICKEKLSSKMFYKAMEKFSNLSYQMTTESFRILSRRVINRTSSMNKTIPYRKAVYANCGLKTDNMQYEIVDNLNSEIDKKENKYRVSLAVDTLIIFTDVGYQFGKTMSVMMMLMTIFVLIYTIAAFILSKPVEGWTSTILFLAVAFLGLFGILTVIIKYLQILVGLVFKRKQYSFESVEKLTK